MASGLWRGTTLIGWSGSPFSPISNVNKACHGTSTTKWRKLLKMPLRSLSVCFSFSFFFLCYVFLGFIQLCESQKPSWQDGLLPEAPECLLFNSWPLDPNVTGFVNISADLLPMQLLTILLLTDVFNKKEGRFEIMSFWIHLWIFNMEFRRILIYSFKEIKYISVLWYFLWEYFLRRSLYEHFRIIWTFS